MRRFGRWLFGLNGTEERIRRTRTPYAILAVLWVVLGVSRFSGPLTTGNVVGIVVSALFVVFLALSVITKTLELRRRA